MRIAVDVMGGDNAPDAILKGCFDAIAELGADDQLVLIGDEALLREEIQEHGLQNDARLQVVGTTQVIGMADSPVDSIRNKPQSSIAVMGQLGGRKAKDRFCDVVISAGNTGACVAAAQMHMRRLPGVHRPGIAVTMPTFHGPVVICDVGANPEPRPSHLFQYGHMAAIVAQVVHGIDNPRVALMSIGGEEGKGNTLTKETHKLLKADSTQKDGINYIGYVEGRDVFNGKADVIVTEGFTGNVVLKLAEGLASGLFKVIAAEILAFDPELAMRFEPVATSIKKKHDYNEYGGAPLLGVNGSQIICHGSSKAKTITAAIRVARQQVSMHLNDKIVAELKRANAIYDQLTQNQSAPDEGAEAHA